MNDIAIRVENLGKRYRIGHAQKRHDTLRDQISDFRFQISDFVKRSARAVLHSNHKSEIENHKSDDTIWALKDVSFDIKRGEVVGIIGRNGAGKSTLLKILSRITKPTEGYADLYGRVASLLEVGTGFHHELTGRENIYLSGAILGMRKAEIDRKFDEMVAFAEIEKFIDTPVKHFSSGMYVRLAFAVAAHLEPEILLVDEVLAVGDAAFQKKCLGKMGDVAKEGRTVLFVSHDMGAIQTLCRRVLWIDRGSIRHDANAVETVDAYLNSTIAHDENRFVRDSTWQLAGIESVRLLDKSGSPISLVPLGESVCFEMTIGCRKKLDTPFFIVTIRDMRGIPVTSINSFESLGDAPAICKGGKVRVCVDKMSFIPGVYSCDVALYRYGEKIDGADHCIQFTIVPSSFYPTGKYPNRNLALVCLPCEWTLEYE